MGQISPCCKFRYQFYKSEVPNINTHTIEDYLNSNTLKTIKDEFNSGKWPLGCERCKIDEENNIPSKRQLDYDRWKSHYDNYDGNGFLTASIGFGNTCNLTCVTCGPEASSKWYTEYLKYYKVEVKPNHFYKNDFVQNFISNAPNIIHLDIPGGEPLLSGVPQQKELLQILVDRGLAKNISLHYTTNGTLFPDSDWLNYWIHFKNVEIQLSIDGIGQKFEYIRYPAIWTDVVENIEKYKMLKTTTHNLNLSVSTTVSAYNIAYLPELTDFLLEIGLGLPYYGKVHYPKIMRPTVWSDKAKQFIINKLQNSTHNFSNYINLLQNENDMEHFENFKFHILRQDNYRKNSFGKAFPEMLNFFQN